VVVVVFVQWVIFFPQILTIFFNVDLQVLVRELRHQQQQQPLRYGSRPWSAYLISYNYHVKLGNLLKSSMRVGAVALTSTFHDFLGTFFSGFCLGTLVVSGRLYVCICVCVCVCFFNNKLSPAPLHATGIIKLWPKLHYIISSGTCNSCKCCNWSKTFLLVWWHVFWQSTFISFHYKKILLFKNKFVICNYFSNKNSFKQQF